MEYAHNIIQAVYGYLYEHDIQFQIENPKISKTVLNFYLKKSHHSIIIYKKKFLVLWICTFESNISVERLQNDIKIDIGIKDYQPSTKGSKFKFRISQIMPNSNVIQTIEWLESVYQRLVLNKILIS